MGYAISLHGKTKLTLKLQVDNHPEFFKLGFLIPFSHVVVDSVKLWGILISLSISKRLIIQMIF